LRVKDLAIVIIQSSKFVIQVVQWNQKYLNPLIFNCWSQREGRTKEMLGLNANNWLLRHSLQRILN